MRSLARAMRPNGFEELAVWRVSGTIDPAFSNACHRWRIFRFPIYFAAASLRASTPLDSTFYRLFVSYNTASIQAVFVPPNASVSTMEEYFLQRKSIRSAKIREGFYLLSAKKLCREGVKSLLIRLFALSL